MRGRVRHAVAITATSTMVAIGCAGEGDVPEQVIVDDDGAAAPGEAGDPDPDADPAADAADADPADDAVDAAADADPADDAVDDIAADPPEPEPEMRPDLLALNPAQATPGDRIAVTFPDETSRGVAFHLDRETEAGWETTHWMTSDANGGEPDTVPAGTEGYGWDDIGIGGPGPDHVDLPDELAPGNQRICTANAGDDLCAPLQVTAE